jgi:hypothetical protein
MKVIASIVVFLAILLSSHTAEAKHHVPSNLRHFAVHPHSPVSDHVYSLGGGGSSLVEAMERYEGGNPTGWHRSWCSRYLGMILTGLGLPTSGSNTAISYARYGHPASPAPGVIAVMPHHVMVVVKVLPNDRVETISGNHGGKVGFGVYSMHRIIAWRSV